MPFVCWCFVVNQHKTNICTQGTKQRDHSMSAKITVVRFKYNTVKRVICDLSWARPIRGLGAKLL